MLSILVLAVCARSSLVDAAQLPDLLPDNFDIRPAFPTDRDPLQVLWNVRSEVVVVNADLICEVDVDGTLAATLTCRVGDFQRVRIPPLPAGMHTVSVEIDTDGRIDELDEDNNRTALTFPVLPSVSGDLVPGRIRLRPRRATAADRLRVSFRVKGRGVVRDASFRCTVRVDLRRVRRAPCVVRTRFVVDLAPLPVGLHQIVAIVDESDRYAETDEDNNIRRLQIRIGPGR